MLTLTLIKYVRTKYLGTGPISKKKPSLVYKIIFLYKFKEK